MMQGLMGGIADKFRGDEGSARLYGLGLLASQLGAGQIPDASPALAMLDQRKAQKAFKNSMADPGMMDMFSEQERAFLSTLPPEAAQSLIAQRVFAAPAAPIEINGQLVDAATGQVVGDYRTPEAVKPVTVNGQLVDPTTGQVVGDYRTAELPEFETKQIKMADGSEVMVERRKGTDDPWEPSQIPEGGTTGAGGGVKLTESQSKLTLFQTLQSETQPVLLELEKQFDPANFSDPAKARVPIAGNYFTSPEYQMYRTAAAAWAEGALRIATGAAATQPEIERNIQTYFAQPGDTPQTVAFKAQMREMYDRAVNNALGQAPTGETLPIPKPSDFADQVQSDTQQQQPSADAPASAVPTSPPDYLSKQDMELWDVFTPEEKAAVLGSYNR